MPRVKRIEHHCSYCNRTAKMEIVGEMEGVPDKSWFRCSKCRHSVLISLEEVMMENPSQEAKIEVKDCTPYSPDKTYDIGQKIVHHEWNDVGKVRTKVTTSSGAHAIIVTFKKLGERRLIESLVRVEEAPLEPSAPETAAKANGETSDQGV